MTVTVEPGGVVGGGDEGVPGEDEPPQAARPTIRGKRKRPLRRDMNGEK
jgi:hypothetical protein